MTIVSLIGSTKRAKVVWLQIMKVVSKFIAILVIASTACASPKEKISSLMQSYWADYSKADFDSAAGYIYPSDLKLAKKELLPIFLDAGDSDDPELNSISDAFFLNIPQESRPSISGKQVFVGLNNFIKSSSPEIFELVAKSKIEILEVSVSDGKSATVTYRLMVEDTPVTDIERFIKSNGKWYVRTKESPKDTATKFRKIFGL